MTDLSKQLQRRARQIRRRLGYWFASLSLQYQVMMNRLRKHTKEDE